MDTLPKVVAAFVETGRIFVGYRHLPLEAIHRQALTAAELAECGRQQGRFWPIHDALMPVPRLTGIDFMEVGHAAGLERHVVADCLNGGATGVVRGDAEAARAFGIRGTPTFLFGTRADDLTFRVLRQASGALSFEVFSKILDQTIQAAEVE
jgi:protein-disulfide isomerase